MVESGCKNVNGGWTKRTKRRTEEFQSRVTKKKNIKHEREGDLYAYQTGEWSKLREVVTGKSPL